MSKKKFGLRRVRPPKTVVEELHYEHRKKKGVRGPMRYCVELTARQASGTFHFVAFLCDARGKRIICARNHLFNPHRYPRQSKRAAAARAPAPALPPDTPEPVPAPQTGDGQSPPN